VGLFGMTPLWMGCSKKFNSVLQPVIFIFTKNTFQASGIICMIPWWGCDSKNFITELQPVIFIFTKNAYQSSDNQVVNTWDYWHDPLVGRRFKEIYHRFTAGDLYFFQKKTYLRRA